MNKSPFKGTLLFTNTYRVDKSVNESGFADKCNEVLPMIKQSMLARAMFATLDGNTTMEDSQRELRRIENKIQNVGKIPSHPLYPTRYTIEENMGDELLVKPIYRYLLVTGEDGINNLINPSFDEAGLLQLNFQLKSGYDESARFKIQCEFPNMDIALFDFNPAQYDYEFVLT